MTTAKQLASSRVVVGFPEQRLSSLAEKIDLCAAQYCVVIASDSSVMLGLVRFGDVAARSLTSTRILSDIMRPPPAHILKESDPADAIEGVFETFGSQEVTVVSLDGAYVGLITPESVAGWLLENERVRKRQLEHLMAEQQRLMDFVETKVTLRMDQLRGTLKEFETLCLSLSHDIRAPMHSIRGYAEIVSEQKALLPAESQHALERIHRLATNAETFAEALLGRARSTFGRSSKSFVTVDLNEAFDDTLSFLDATLRERKARVSVRNRLHLVEGYYVPILQILINLIGNALKYVPANRAPVVEIWTEDTGAAIVLNIQDNGVGVPRHRQEMLFTPFAPRTDQPRDGTGLGLSIVRSATTQLGGSINISSSEGIGSVFSVTLRRGQQAPAQQLTDPRPEIDIAQRES